MMNIICVFLAKDCFLSLAPADIGALRLMLSIQSTVGFSFRYVVVYIPVKEIASCYSFSGKEVNYEFLSARVQ